MSYDVIVIGAGIMGVSSALTLAEGGLKTLVIDSLPLKNGQNASNDVSRIFRTYQGNDELKVQMAIASRFAWEALSERYLSRDIFRPCPVLILDTTEDDMPTPTKDISWLGSGGLQFRFPNFRGNTAILDMSGAILNAGNAVVTLAKAAKSAGAMFIHGRAVHAIDKGTVTLDDGTIIDGGMVVVACGSWTKQLLGERAPIRATRQEVAFFKPDSLDKYGIRKFPVFAHLPTWFYGFPDHGVGAVKIARHTLGPEIDPNEHTRDASADFISECRDFFSDTIPGLADAALLRSRTCRYAVRDGEEFLIDRIDAHTVVATAFRGEGFKFAPAVGLLVAHLVDGGVLHPKYKRFRL